MRSAKIAGLDDAERTALIDFLSWNRLCGDVVKGTGGVRKIRWAPFGRSKSGGFRAIYYYRDDDTPLFAFLVYGKGQTANLSEKQKKDLSIIIAAIQAKARRRNEKKERVK